jgi:hypothetical protein
MAANGSEDDVPETRPTRRRRESLQQRREERLTNWAFAITSVIKLGGLLIAANEALLNPEPHDPVVFAVAAFMMAGAQGIDSFLSSMLGGRK